MRIPSYEQEAQLGGVQLQQVRIEPSNVGEGLQRLGAAAFEVANEKAQREYERGKRAWMSSAAIDISTFARNRIKQAEQSQDVDAGKEAALRDIRSYAEKYGAGLSGDLSMEYTEFAQKALFTHEAELINWADKEKQSRALGKFVDFERTMSDAIIAAPDASVRESYLQQYRDNVKNLVDAGYLDEPRAADALNKFKDGVELGRLAKVQNERGAGAAAALLKTLDLPEDIKAAEGMRLTNAMRAESDRARAMAAVASQQRREKMLFEIAKAGAEGGVDAQLKVANSLLPGIISTSQMDDGDKASLLTMIAGMNNEAEKVNAGITKIANFVQQGVPVPKSEAKANDLLFERSLQAEVASKQEPQQRDAAYWDTALQHFAQTKLMPSQVVRQVEGMLRSDDWQQVKQASDFLRNAGSYAEGVDDGLTKEAVARRAFADAHIGATPDEMGEKWRERKKLAPEAMKQFEADAKTLIKDQESGFDVDSIGRLPFDVQSEMAASLTGIFRNPIPDIDIAQAQSFYDRAFVEAYKSSGSKDEAMRIAKQSLRTEFGYTMTSGQLRLERNPIENDPQYIAAWNSAGQPDGDIYRFTKNHFAGLAKQVAPDKEYGKDIYFERVPGGTGAVQPFIAYVRPSSPEEATRLGIWGSNDALTRPFAPLIGSDGNIVMAESPLYQLKTKAKQKEIERQDEFLKKAQEKRRRSEDMAMRANSPGGTLTFDPKTLVSGEQQ